VTKIGASTDESVTKLAQVLVSTDSAVRASQTVLEQIGNDTHALVGDPALGGSLREIQAILSHVDATAGQLEEGSRRVPGIADSVQKIAATSSKYQKAFLLARIFSYIAGAFF
jgi:hypothetical protein